MGIFDNVNWGDLLTSGLNLLGSKQNAGANQQTANTYAQQTKFNPYNVLAGNSGVLFNGNSALGSLSKPYQDIQGQLTSGAGGLLGNIGQTFQSGGINPFLQGSFDQYNQGSPQAPSNLGSQFNTAGQGFLNSLGGFDPNQAAGNYTNVLRQQAQPGNERAAQGLAQNLFNTGRLGTTGGQGLFGELINQQNQQDLGFQQAGMQYGGQEQNRIAGLGQSFGQLGDQLNSNTFNQTNARAQQRFQNAMQLFGAGQQNSQNQLGAGLGLLQGSQGLDSDLLKAIQTGGYLGGASSSANSTAYNPSLQAGVAGNNASSAGWLGLAQSLGLPDMLGGQLSKLFGGSGGSQMSTPLTDPGVDQNNVPNPNFNFNDPTDPKYAFSGAGGQAASNPTGSIYGPTSGNAMMRGLFGDNSYDFLGGPGSLPSGLQNLDFSKTLNDPNLTNAQVAQNLGVDPKLLGGSGFNLGKVTSGIGDALGIYGGVKQGGVQGYTQAANSAASLAGYDIPALGYTDAVSKAVKGDIPSAAISAISTYLPVAGVAFAAGSLLNKAFMGGKAEDRNWALLTQAGGVKNIILPGGHSAAFNGAALPDGRLISGQDSKKLADLYWYATQEGTHQQELADFLKNVQPAKLPRGYHWDQEKRQLVRD